MNKKGAFILGFIVGAVAGCTSTYFLVKKKIEDRADKEIEEVIERFRDRSEPAEQTIENDSEEDVIEEIHNAIEVIDKDKETALTIIKELQYDQTSEESEYTVQIENDDGIKPYIITEDEYGEFGNEEINLMYYADGILADDYDNIVSDVEETVGDALKSFDNDQYLETLYVRNEERLTDYVILRSENNYTDIVERSKNHNEDYEE